MDVCVNNFKDVRVRRETFFDWCGVPDTQSLSNYGFFHLGDQLLCCAYCDETFISWSEDLHFFRKHRELNCVHMSKDFMVWSSIEKHDQTVENWLQKPAVEKIKNSGIFTGHELHMALKDFLNKKGNYASVNLFHYYLKNFSHNMKSKIEIVVIK